MAEDIPISEVRRVVIEYEIRVPRGGAARAAQQAPALDEDALVEKVRRELIRTGSRNPDIFGGRA